MDKDYRTLYMETLDLAARAMNNVADGVAHLNTGNLAHEGVGVKCNARQWAKIFSERRLQEETSVPK